MSDTYDKFEGGVAVVIVVAFIMVAVGILFSFGGPAFPNPAPGTHSVLMYPSADSGTHNGELNRTGNGAGCAGVLEWCLVEELPQDENATYLSYNPLDNGRGTYFMTDVSIPGGASIDSVTIFAWAKKNQTANVSVGVSFEYFANPGYSSCASLTNWPIPDMTQAFANHTMAATVCDGTHPWTQALLNAGEYIIFDTSSVPWSVTSIGMVVTYTVPTTPSSDLALLLPFALVAVAVIFVVAYLVRVRRHE